MGFQPLNGLTEVISPATTIRIRIRVILNLLSDLYKLSGRRSDPGPDKVALRFNTEGEA